MVVTQMTVMQKVVVVVAVVVVAVVHGQWSHESHGCSQSKLISP